MADVAPSKLSSTAVEHIRQTMAAYFAFLTDEEGKLPVTVVPPPGRPPPAPSQPPPQPVLREISEELFCNPNHLITIPYAASYDSSVCSRLKVRTTPALPHQPKSCLLTLDFMGREDMRPLLESLDSLIIFVRSLAEVRGQAAPARDPEGFPMYKDLLLYGTPGWGKVTTDTPSHPLSAPHSHFRLTSPL